MSTWVKVNLKFKVCTNNGVVIIYGLGVRLLRGGGKFCVCTIPDLHQSPPVNSDRSLITPFERYW